ncbi:hypothetical protein GcM1_211061 [Golovinomyces cichoracearum]|uniref:Uncharacterized protein n=1 Tax=Golovinomyces cichoracearum TaxID=62708 RepID=A0A420IVF5_9PEZI|nr:hypothetical protein GcM1_211061 [Golovinomyces cichoracearum]
MRLFLAQCLYDMLLDEKNSNFVSRLAPGSPSSSVMLTGKRTKFYILSPSSLAVQFLRTHKYSGSPISAPRNTSERKCVRKYKDFEKESTSSQDASVARGALKAVKEIIIPKKKVHSTSSQWILSQDSSST